MTKKRTRFIANVYKRIGIAWAFLLAVFVSAMFVPTACLALSADDATPSERAACTADVFRLCGSEIPNVDRIVACLVAKRARLSAPCKSVLARREREALSARNSR
jgi:hypothetical protein